MSELVNALIGGVMGHYACYNGDTWSFELDILSKAKPRIESTFKVLLRLFLIAQTLANIYFFHYFILILF
jgi:hypothetical protein